jgi:hypothetical protein
MKKIEKKFSIIALGAVFLLLGIFRFLNGEKEHTFIYFGIGTWTAALLYYSIMVKHPQIVAFIAGLIVLHTGVLLIIKSEHINSIEISLLTFVCGILVLLNSGFSEYLHDRKKRS